MGTGRQQLLLGPAASDKSILGTLPLTRARFAKSLTGYWIGTRVYWAHQATAAAVIRDQQA
jgi:hypothetical protein